MSYFIPGRVKVERGRMVTGRRKAATFGTGRTCTECGTKISKYNPNDTCWAHSPLKVPHHRSNLR